MDVCFWNDRSKKMSGSRQNPRKTFGNSSRPYWVDGVTFAPYIWTLINEAEAVIAIENCIQDVRAWMRDDKLMLNDDKTEFLIIDTERQLSRVSVDKIKIGQAEVSPVSSVRNLGTWFDSHLDMSTLVTKACASAFYYLYNIRHIRKYLSRESTERLVHAFITSRLDYCNSLLYGAPEHQIKKLQRVMNASARLVYRAPKYCHITPLLRELHWLPVRFRIDFKILLITFKILHGVAPSYLKDLVSLCLTGLTLSTTP
ncbi:hypothetical protein ACROYT_G018932 [Oculina patagonica]